MSCGRYAALLHGYADGELDAANVIDMEEHLSSCRTCHEALSQVQLVRSSIDAARLKYEAPERLRSQVARMARKGPDRAGFHWIAPGLSGALAASLALLVALPSSPEPQLEQEIVESHVRSLLADHLIDVASTSRHVVRPWFSGKLDFSPRVPDLTDEGFKLVGGRLDYFGQRVVAAMVYRSGRHVINLYAWPAQPAADASGESQGYSLEEWTEDGLRYVAVSDAGPRELARFRVSFRRSAADGGR